MEKVLISSCLVGNKVRYNAGCLSISDADFQWLNANVELVVFCPEVSSGLPIPRPPAEIISGQGIDVIQGNADVVRNDGHVVTNQFLAGANNALEICREQQIQFAILAEGSPSCGSNKIYDGTFNGIKIDGSGVTTALLKQNGVSVFSQHTILELQAALRPFI
ncbi:DUF523 domain-containing protein [uncultured Vibrio sp.]|uniref:DUF523 domain-containing protein n=1 Tax=uncultured Vibrio sp. TaxID=114054 RepID=UPI0025E90D38|nr:DUF523 domain-containing protein [uncultured Vibrio sp.]